MSQGVRAEHNHQKMAPQIDTSKLWKVDEVLLKQERCACVYCRQTDLQTDKASFLWGGQNLPAHPQRDLAELKGVAFFFILVALKNLKMFVLTALQ